jgi:hypothetical protein
VLKRIISYGAVFIAVLMVAGVLAVVVERYGASTRKSDDNVASLLFTVDARASQIVESPVDPDEDLLVLYGVDPAAVWFTDRPDRQSGLMPLADLMSDWESLGFVDDPPNAAVAFRDGSRAVVELTYPRYDPAAAVWLATIQYLPGSPSSPDKNADLGAANVFIDDAEWNLTALDPDDPVKSPSGPPESVAIPVSPNDVYSLPASSLISNFSDHHLDYVQDGVQLYGGGSLADDESNQN